GRHTGREAVGVARGPARGRRAGPALHRPAPGARGDQPAGVRRVAAGRPAGAPARPHHRHRGPQRADRRHRAADRGQGLRDPGGDAAPQLRRVRRAAARDGRPRAGHRARDRPAAGADPARHDHRLRGLAHQHARRVRRAGVRHRHQRGRARPGHPDAAAASTPDHGGHRRRRPAGGGHRQGRRAGADRPDRHRRRPGPHGGVPRGGDRGAVDGVPDDDLQHVDRGRRPGRHDRPGRDHVRLPQGPAARAGGRRLGRRAGALADAADRAGRDLRPRGGAGRGHAGAVRDLGDQPRAGRAAVRPGAGPGRDRRRQPAGRGRVRPGLHGAGRGHADAGRRGGHRVPRLLHQRADRGPARRGRRPAGPAGRRRRPDAGRAGLDAGQGAGRAGGPARGLPGRRGGVALGRLLDVPGHEPGPARPRGALGQHQQPQLRGPAGQGRPDPPGVAAGGRRDRGDRPADRPGRPV
ncbi:MAG: 3-isopropylmalate dehydratase large subunit, partial [uncultured Corynebacteriales bacterium]